MTALTALRANFQESKEDSNNLERRTFSRQQHRQRQRIIEEPHPEVLLNQKEKEKQQAKLRCRKPSLPATIEDASEDEELATTSDCSLSGGSLEGPSPHVLPPEERFWYCLPANQAFSSHPLISPKFGRRSPTPLSLRAATVTAAGLQSQGFTDPAVRRKRSLSSLGERLSGASFDLLPNDFLNLPPIPETVPVRKTSERQASSSTEEEEEEEEEVAEEDVSEEAYSSERSDSSVSK